jgi:hypothetical protein
MKLLHGNFTRLPPDDRAAFVDLLVEEARLVTDADLNALLDYEWRARLTAAWLIAVDRRVRFRERLREMLLASELVYAGEGYCVAFARFGEPTDADALVGYLRRYLPRVDCSYNQHWALGALLNLDPDRAAEFTGEPWERSAMRGLDPFTYRDAVAQLLAFLPAER